MLAEVLIFVPSIANFRVTWLTDRLTAARLASLAAEAAPGGIIPENVRGELLSTAQLRSVAIKTGGMRKLVLPADAPFVVDAMYDLRMPPSSTPIERLSMRFGLIADALAVFFAPEGRMILVHGQPDPGTGPATPVTDFVEIVLPEAKLKAAMVRYGLNILYLSIIISIIAAALVYVALSAMFVRPMMRITRNMLYFSENPEDASRIIAPSERRDEIGIAERELARMQRQLAQTLHQKSRLAQLGLAVSKINHDLRNMLASAQLISDRLTALPDPTVQRFAPKLIASLDRAISFCNDTLQFGRTEEAAPRRELFALGALIEEVGEGVGLPRDGIGWRVAVDPALRVDADPEHMFRVLNNLCRNAVQAIESQGPQTSGEVAVEARREGRRSVIDVRDSGPGVSGEARARLFQAFGGSARKGGSGLGLAIASELVQAHGGTLVLLDAPRGAAFRIEIPDRGTAAPG
ncbi:MAG: HAMP domain-containing histidine kinase [Hyphomicrobiaceae bacterium]|nr:HAMP domain-containing histidine kinase [Hyphomicrobiaceae bacterium]